MNSHINRFFRLIVKHKIITMLSVVIFCFLLFETVLIKKYTESIRSGNLSALQMTPWASIGGCGAGGSGGGSSTVKWVGQGINGGLLDIQVMGNSMSGRDFWNKSFSARLSCKPSPITQVGLSIPYSMKFGPVQPSSALPRTYEQANGLGDLTIDALVNLGTEGQYCFSLSLGLPTGQYNIVRGYDQKSNILPLGLQSGTGLLVPTVGLAYTKDVEKGIWIADISYTHPVVASVHGKNEFVDTYYKAFKDSTKNDRFYYHFKPYGENDLGDYVPPSISASLFYGIRSNLKYTHSLGLSFSAPLGIAWIHEESIYNNVSLYNPRPDADNKAWSGQLSYGIERGDDKFPLFFAIVKPIHDKTNSSVKDYGKWDAPDMKALLNEWGFSIGIKTTTF
jgi:hypothetical protein